MSSIMNTQSGERLSFFKLFKEKNYRILIPIIQRDYAQGRKDKREIRETFLNYLYKYLDENIPNRDLDFVYGSLSSEENITDFIPLDGQQRLTTLFLLHWYLYQISDNTQKKEEYINAVLKDGKSMFTYETRSSSTEFCNAILNNDIDFKHLLESDKDLKAGSNDNSLSKTIKNCSWFYLSWEFDPTIQSMLTMLDAIHNRFAGKKEFFHRLLDLENPTITFLFLNLKDFKLTDDLYIKMNSRGKALTPFENFKAKFGQYLENIKGESLPFHGPMSENVTLKDYFSHNIDTKWSYLFWNYRTLQNSSDDEIDYSIDDKLMNFIRVIFTYQYAMNVNVSQKDKDDTLEYLLGTNIARNESDYSDIISFSKYQELKALSIDSIYYLVNAFDVFTNGHEKIKLHLSNNYVHYFDENETFEKALNHKFDIYNERVSFHAYVRYLIYNKHDRSGIDQWIRVIHNLTHPENTIIDRASDVVSVIKSIEKLLPESNNILEYLKLDTTITSFSSWQILEEKIKAHLITKNDNWKNKIESVEKHGYFNGQIGFILEFAGISEYYETNKNCNWSGQADSEYFRKFSDYADKACKVFEENNVDYLFERAVLTKGDYLTSASEYRKNLLTTNHVKKIQRDHSWKRLLRIIDDETSTMKRLFVKQIFDDQRFDKDRLENSLKSICKDKTDTWRDYFIAYPKLIEYCRQGFIRFEDENNILLYRESQSNHIHVEMYSYHLWKKYFEPQINLFKCFKNIYYYEVKSISDHACIVLDESCYNRIYYIICIYNNDSLSNSYKISFIKSRGENMPEKYGEEIKKVLSQCDFQWDNEENTGYFITVDDENGLMVKVKQLDKLLEKIKSRTPIV